MRRVSGNEYATFTVALSAKEVLRPFIDGEHLELHRHPKRPSEDLRHIIVARRRRMQSPMACAVLQDDEGKDWSFGDVMMPALAHRNALVQIVTMEKRLPELSDVPFT